MQTFSLDDYNNNYAGLLISHQLIMHLSAFTTKRMKKWLLVHFYDEFLHTFMDIDQPVWWWWTKKILAVYEASYV